MNQKIFAKWLKLIVVGVGICGAIVYLYLVPAFGKDLASQYPGYQKAYVPWLITILLTAIPCYVALVLGWIMARDIGRDLSFTRINARRLQLVSYLAIGDVAFFFTMNFVFLLLQINHPGIFLVTLLIDFAGITVAVMAAVASHLVEKATCMQEENELTI